MTRRARGLAAVSLVVGCLPLSSPALTADRSGSMRIVLLVDSSSAVAPMLNDFRKGINAFLDLLPEDAEVAMISTGGQLRIRVPATSDRQKLHDGANHFAQDGGGNAFLDTLIEADRRFLRSAPDKRPVFVIVTTDIAETRAEARVDKYNAFLSDFVRRGGIAHAVVVKGHNSGFVTDITLNLTGNTSGIYDAIALSNGLQSGLEAIGRRVAADDEAAQP